MAEIEYSSLSLHSISIYNSPSDSHACIYNVPLDSVCKGLYAAGKGEGGNHFAARSVKYERLPGVWLASVSLAQPGTAAVSAETTMQGAKHHSGSTGEQSVGQLAPHLDLSTRCPLILVDLARTLAAAL